MDYLIPARTLDFVVIIKKKKKKKKKEKKERVKKKREFTISWILLFWQITK